MARIDVMGSEAKRAAINVERFAISETLAMTTEEIKTLTKNCISYLNGSPSGRLYDDRAG